MTDKTRVFVVDDEESILDAIGTLLAQDGYDVRTFICAADALEACSAGCPEIVVADFVMPGMSGGALAEALEDRYGPERPAIVCVTGFLADLRPGVRRLFDRVLEKPYAYADLAGVLRELGLPPARSELYRGPEG